MPSIDNLVVIGQVGRSLSYTNRASLLQLAVEGIVEFCPWYSAADAGVIAPPRPGVFQVKRLGSVLIYPRGKSAMVHYGFAENVQRAISRVASNAGKIPRQGTIPLPAKGSSLVIPSLVYRHLIDDVERAERAGLDSAHLSPLSLEQARLLAADFISRFAARFGCVPSMTPTISS